MDKKSVLIGILFLSFGFILMLHNAMREAENRREASPRQTGQQEQTQSPSVAEPRGLENPPTRDDEIVSGVDSPRPLGERMDIGESQPSQKPGEQAVVLENET